MENNEAWKNFYEGKSGEVKVRDFTGAATHKTPATQSVKVRDGYVTCKDTPQDNVKFPSRLDM